MKKWSSTELTINCDDDTSFKNNVKFTYTPVEEDGTLGTPIVFFTWENFYDIMLERYTDFNYLTGSYYSSVSNSEVELCDTFAKALAKFKKSVNTFVLDKQNAFEKLYYALYQDYNPIHNYDKTLHSTMEFKGKETSSTDYTGEESNVLTKSGDEINTEKPSGWEKDTLTKSGKEATTFAKGVELENDYKATFDQGSDPLYKVATKEIEGNDSDTDVAYKDNTEVVFGGSGADARKDETKHEYSTDRQTETTLSFDERTDSNLKSFTDRNDTTEKSFTNRKDEYNLREFGNVGVYTTTQKMITEQFPIADFDEIHQYIMSCFVHKYLIV